MDTNRTISAMFFFCWARFTEAGCFAVEKTQV